MSSTKNEEVFNTAILNYTIEEFIMGLDNIMKNHLPEGKTLENFTGGYIQQLKNSNRLTCFFGMKADGRNKATTQVTIATEDLDMVYLMLKCKVQDLHNKDSKIPKISASEVMRNLTKPAAFGQKHRKK